MSSFMRGISSFISMGNSNFPMIEDIDGVVGVRNKDGVVRRSLCGIGLRGEVSPSKTNKWRLKIIHKTTKSPKDTSSKCKME
jgi:hypothetical protein